MRLVSIKMCVVIVVVVVVVVLVLNFLLDIIICFGATDAIPTSNKQFSLKEKIVWI